MPEKSTVIPEHFPDKITYPSPIYGTIDRSFGALSVIPTFDLFRSSEHRLLSFPRTDAHLTAIGSLVLLRHLIPICFPEADPRLLTALNEPSLIAREPQIMAGPLGHMLFGAAVYEECLTLRLGALAEFGDGVLIDEVNPPAESAHVGSRRVWRNPSAPIQAKVVAVGNSFFERGVAYALSWWFKHMVAEFHFVWDFNMDDAYIDQVRPDVVLFQSIERFLTTVPSS